MITLLVVSVIIAFITFLYFRQGKEPNISVFRYAITVIVTFGIILVGLSAYHGSGSYGSFSYEPSNHSLGILIFIWASIVACSPLAARKYKKPKLFITIVALGALSIILIPTSIFLT